MSTPRFLILLAKVLLIGWGLGAVSVGLGLLG